MFIQSYTFGDRGRDMHDNPTFSAPKEHLKFCLHLQEDIP